MAISKNGHTPCPERRPRRSWSLDDLSLSYANLPDCVAIFGPTGAGKEAIARALHDRSFRAKEPFIDVNCGAITDTLGDTFFFGCEKNVHSRALELTRGVFERARGGTLFLDEIAELSRDHQTLLLRVLNDGTFRRVGGTVTLQFRGRVVLATHKDLWEEVLAVRFRDDLYFRLVKQAIQVPALAQRKDEIEAKANEKLGALKSGWSFGPEAVAVLHRYPWPGNFRELDNLVARVAARAEGPVIDEEDVLEFGILKAHLSSLAPATRDEKAQCPMAEPEPAPKPPTATPPPWTDAVLAKGRGGDIFKYVVRALASRAIEVAASHAGAAKLLGVNRQRLYRELRSPKFK